MDIDEAQDRLARVYYQNKLKAKLEEMKRDGLENIRLTPGDDWEYMSKEDRAQIVLEILASLERMEKHKLKVE